MDYFEEEKLEYWKPGVSDTPQPTSPNQVFRQCGFWQRIRERD